MARFFYLTGSCDETELIDAIANRYGWTVPDIERLDIVRIQRLYVKAVNARNEEIARQQWTAMLPFMSLKMLKFVSFDDYKAQITGANLDLRSDEEILAEVQDIRKQFTEDKNGSV